MRVPPEVLEIVYDYVAQLEHYDKYFHVLNELHTNRLWNQFMLFRAYSYTILNLYDNI